MCACAERLVAVAALARQPARGRECGVRGRLTWAPGVGAARVGSCEREARARVMSARPRREEELAGRRTVAAPHCRAPEAGNELGARSKRSVREPRTADCGRAFVPGHDLRAPTETRSALRYVLMNAQKHHRVIGDRAVADPLSSAASFDGYARAPATFGDLDPWPRVAPRTWLLGVGWRQRGGLLDPADALRRAGQERGRLRSGSSGRGRRRSDRAPAR